MALLDFILRAGRRPLQIMGLLTVIAGLANALLVVIVNQVAQHVAVAERPDLTTALIFVLAFVAYYQCNKFALLRANRIIEVLLNRLRLGVMDRLRRAELRDVEQLRRGQLYTLVSQETNYLSVTFPLLVDSFQQAILLIISLAYLLYLSPAAFLVFLLCVFAGVIAYHRINERMGDTLRRLHRFQARLLDAIGDIINGSKELRLNSRKSESVFQSYRKLSRATEATLIESGEQWTAMILLSSAVIFAMLGIVGFGFPHVVGNHGDIVFQLVPVLLFCVAPFAKIVSQSPMFVRAEVSLQGVLEIERQLGAADMLSPSDARAAAAAYRDFRTIRYSALTFTHRDATGAGTFTLGPLDLTVQRGETLFLVGGNGSGKSTALRLMTGLYAPESGSIWVDEAPVVGRDVAGFRELFAAIFVDFHLFDRLYGLENVPAEQVNLMIEEMGLAGKVRYEDGRFSTTQLSTGQRKRLALIATLLEDRPVYVFDEWSAEQDVHFRAYFYNTVLRRLKAQGKTVIAVTHDERYWHLADRVVKLDLGKVEWQRKGSELEAP